MFDACLKGAKEKGVICGKGVYEAGTIVENPAMRQAYDMGKQV